MKLHAPELLMSMQLSHLARQPVGVVALAILSLIGPPRVDAQIFRAEFTNIVIEAGPKDWSRVDQPDWQPADGVEPLVIPTVTYDSRARRWRYQHTIINGPAAAQELKDLWMYTLNVDSAGGPPNWYALKSNNRPDNLGKIAWWARLPDVPVTAVAGQPASAYQIPPGDSLAGFVYTSMFAPAHVARVHAQGHVDAPYSGGEYLTPPPDVNSAMTYTIGPSIVAVFLPPIIPINEVEAAESLLLLELAPVPEEGKGIPAQQLPPVLGIRFIAEDDQIDISTLEVALNGQDVTALFHPAGPDLDDILIGVLSPHTSPLQEGTNIVSAQVKGVPVGGTALVIDADQLHFEVTRLHW
jgi:hypothetical protein